ncbi:glycosyltransferase [Chryseobacterium taihuense]|uniref:Glycosyltransferase involved in cell wall bisynthesis n=1 Tax=Chryseobacterium taihuense TaxID=1141221 RepID=A0ABY0QSF6_9FLAO|nr:glycosyltransferase [Chryseobacterium taihuense]SDL71315.1 Glycosyltransferase involved in cell wall bisynthesis [Chryseobacterium taihuense]
MILFLSRYPEKEEDFRDGLFQRVVHIDSLFSDKKKVYLVASPYRYFKKKYSIDKTENRIIVKYNLFVHFFLILSIYKESKIIYIHSIHNLLYQFIFLLFFSKKFILDLHGLVPEEFALQRDFKREFIFNKVEKIVYEKFDVVIGVTNNMISHYKRKYPNATPEYIVYPILPNNLESTVQKKSFTIEHKNNKVQFIYSGNLQAWQNIDLMLDCIKNISENNRYFFQILTGEVDKMKKKVKEKNIKCDNVDIRGVKTNELAEYYEKAHYGFVLRENIPVNNVACPTKIVEYMNYGIIPIVLSSKIGDFERLKYDYVSLENLDMTLLPRKSLHNKNLIKSLYDESHKSKAQIINLYRI